MRGKQSVQFVYMMIKIGVARVEMTQIVKSDRRRKTEMRKIGIACIQCDTHKSRERATRKDIKTTVFIFQQANKSEQFKVEEKND